MNGDLISRQAAIDEIRTMQTYKLFAGDDMLLVDKAEAMTNLMMMPPAEPRTGEWLDDCGGMACSYCGFSCDDPYYLGEANYCPNCGANMEESDEHTD